MKMDELFQEASYSSGRLYLESETKLRKSGDAALPTLRSNLQNSDPLARLIAKCLRDLLEGRAPDYEPALNYLDSLPQRLARTPITSPPPTGVAAYLTQHFGARVVEFLALRLVKETDWPHWRVMGVIFYLKDQGSPSTTAALLRFATDTRSEEWRSAAIEAIRATKDPDLSAKIAAERQRVEQQKKAFPAPLVDLESTNRFHGD